MAGSLAQVSAQVSADSVVVLPIRGSGMHLQLLPSMAAAPDDKKQNDSTHSLVAFFHRRMMPLSSIRDLVAIFQDGNCVHEVRMGSSGDRPSRSPTHRPRIFRFLEATSTASQ